MGLADTVPSQPSPRRGRALYPTRHFETPVFVKLLAERKVERTPILEVIKRHPKEIILSAFARMAEQAPFYIFTAFIFSYGTSTLHVSRDFLLTAVLAASVLSFFSIPFFGHLSDRIGRKNMYMIVPPPCCADWVVDVILTYLPKNGTPAKHQDAQTKMVLSPHDPMAKAKRRSGSR